LGVSETTVSLRIRRQTDGRFFHGMQHGPRVRRLGHRKRLGIEVVFNEGIVPAHALHHLDDLCHLLLVDHRQLKRKLGTMFGENVFAALRR
jgi:hypothetical protein